MAWGCLSQLHRAWVQGYIPCLMRAAPTAASACEPPAPRRLFVLLLQIEAWALLVFMLAKYVGLQQFTTLGVDFPKHYAAALEILRGSNPYDGELYLGFNYPLFTGWLFLFLAPFSLETAGLVWDVCNTLLVLGALGLVLFGYKPEPGTAPETAARVVCRYWHSVAAFAFAIFAPVFLEIRDGNIEPLNLFLLVALGAALLRGRERTVGVLLAMLCLVKILPVFFLPVLYITGKRRAIYVCLVCLAVYAAVLLATGWWRWECFLLSQTLPHVGYHYRGLSNSLAAQAGRYFAPTLWESEGAFRIASIAIAASMGSACLAVLLIRKQRVPRAQEGGASPARFFQGILKRITCPHLWREGLGLASLTIVLISPLLEYQHLIWAMPAYLFLLMDYAEGRVSNRFFSVCAVLWLAVFACRYATDLGMPLFMDPLHFSTWLAGALWLVMAVRLAAGRPRAGHVAGAQSERIPD